MFRIRGRTDHQYATTIALVLLTGCGTASTPASAPGSGSTPANVSAPTVASAPILPSTIATASAISTSVAATPAAGATVATAGARPVAPAAAKGGSIEQKLTFTGDLNGSFTTTPPPDLCGKKDQTISGTLHHTFGAGLIKGKINDDTYGFSFTLPDYHGPDTYKDAAVVTLANLATQDVLLNVVNNDTVVVVAASETSGTVESDVKSTPPSKPTKVHISGTWRCS